jgi:hypothetical protein
LRKEEALLEMKVEYVGETCGDKESSEMGCSNLTFRTKKLGPRGLTYISKASTERLSGTI